MSVESSRHLVSAYDRDDRVTRQLTFPEPLTIFDSTLRKILLTPGISPPIDQLLAIAGSLDRAGIREIVLNVHWWGDDRPNSREWEVLRAVLQSGFDFHVTVYADATLPREGNRITPLAAIEQIRSLGATTIELPFLVPRAGGGGAASSLGELEALFAQAADAGLSTVLGLSDVGRVDFEVALEAAQLATELGCTRVNLLDSYSSLSVEAMRLFCNDFRARLDRPVPLSMHVHNDFGLGTALAVTAATSGVHPDVSVNSISYRSGFAALQEVVLALELLYDVRTGIDLGQLQSLSDQVSACTGLVNPLAPVTGAHQYLRDDAEGILDYLRDGREAFPAATSCMAPSLTGSRMRVVWGDRHATSTVRAKLRQLGLPDSGELVTAVYDEIVRAVDSATTYPRWVTEERVEEICRVTAARLGDGYESR
ncbi:hypothetical protein [Amycolatopsis jejuensis]|uniref:hypothetical protein n=1 Tax=Amycolatopsis jejuensis TaxID=330084 RepID=UPI00068DAD6B|nr:hypothetical protein [Amycolatopsis jejuensis]